MVTLPGPRGHHPSQDVSPEPLGGSPRWPFLSLPTIPGTPPKAPAPGRWLRVLLTGMGAPGHSGRAQSDWEPKNFSKRRENPYALRRTRTTYLQPTPGLGPSLGGELPPLLPGTDVTRSQGPLPPAPREPEPWAGAGEPGSPYLSASPAPRSWGPCGWSAFSPGRSAAWFLAGAGLTCESTEGGPAAPPQVRTGSGSLA